MGRALLQFMICAVLACCAAADDAPHTFDCAQIGGSGSHPIRTCDWMFTGKSTSEGEDQQSDQLARGKACYAADCGLEEDDAIEPVPGGLACASIAPEDEASVCQEGWLLDSGKTANGCIGEPCAAVDNDLCCKDGSERKLCKSILNVAEVCGDGWVKDKNKRKTQCKPENEGGCDRATCCKAKPKALCKTMRSSYCGEGWVKDPSKLGSSCAHWERCTQADKKACCMKDINADHPYVLDEERACDFCKYSVEAARNEYAVNAYKLRKWKKPKRLDKAYEAVENTCGNVPKTVALVIAEGKYVNWDTVAYKYGGTIKAEELREKHGIDKDDSHSPMLRDACRHILKEYGDHIASTLAKKKFPYKYDVVKDVCYEQAGWCGEKRGDSDAADAASDIEAEIAAMEAELADLTEL